MAADTGREGGGTGIDRGDRHAHQGDRDTDRRAGRAGGGDRRRAGRADPQPGWVRRLLGYVWRYRTDVVLALGSSLAGMGVMAVVPLITKVIIDDVIGAHTRSLGVWVGIFLAAALVVYVLAFVRRYYGGRLGLSVQHDLRTDMYDAIVRLDGRRQDELSTGQVVGRSTSDLQLIQGLLFMLPMTIGNVLLFVVSLAVMVWLSLPLTLVALGVAPAVLFIVKRSRPRLHAATWDAQAKAAAVAGVVEGAVTGVRVVKGFGQEEQETGKLRDVGRRLFAARLRTIRLTALYTPALQVVPAFGQVAMLALGGWLAVRGQVTLGTFVAFSTYLAQLIGPVRMLAVILTMGQQARAGVERVLEVIDTEPTLTDGTKLLPADAPATVEFDDVSFAYAPAQGGGAAEAGAGGVGVAEAGAGESSGGEAGVGESSGREAGGDAQRPVAAGTQGSRSAEAHAPAAGRPDAGRPGRPGRPTGGVLRGLSFDIRAGETVAVVGSSGCGKSTLALLLPRLYDVTHGAVLVGGHDVRELTLDSLRAAIGLVPEDSFLFSDTVRANIAYGQPDATQEQIEAAARAAQAHDFITALPEGYDTTVGEQGLTLSGGQRQRIALARAVLTDPRLLILDDATSAVDARVEHEIHAALREIMAGRTTLLIAHRRSTLTLADRIAVLDGGRLADIGTHEELTERCALYRRLLTDPGELGRPSAGHLPPAHPGSVHAASADAAPVHAATVHAEPPHAAPPHAAPVHTEPGEAVLDRAVRDHAMLDQATSDDARHDRAASDDAGSDDVTSDHGASHRAAPGQLPTATGQHTQDAERACAECEGAVAELDAEFDAAQGITPRLWAGERTTPERRAAALAGTPPGPDLLAQLDALPPAADIPAVDEAHAMRPEASYGLRRLLPGFRAPLLISLLMVAVDAGVGLLLPVLIRHGIDEGVNRLALGAVWTAATVALVAVLVQWGAQIGETRMMGRTGERILYALRLKIFAQLQRLGLDYYERELSGRIMTRMTTDVDALSTFLQTGLVTAFVSLVTFFGIMVALLAIDVQLALVVFTTLPVLVIGTYFFRRQSVRAYELARERVSVVNADLQETVAGLRIVQAFRRERAGSARFAERSSSYRGARMRGQWLISVYFPFVQLLSSAAGAAVLIVGAGRIADATLTTGALVAYLLYIDLFFAPVQQLSQVVDGYQQATVSLGRVQELLREPTSTKAALEPRPVGVLRGEVCFEDVVFDYGAVAASAGERALGGHAEGGHAEGGRAEGGRVADERPEAVAGSGTARHARSGSGAAGEAVRSGSGGAGEAALRGITLRIPAGQTVAFVGETGAGKSTLIKLVARFYDPTAGRLTVDGVGIRDLDLTAYRRRLGVVPQEAFLFEGTVRDAIAYGRPDATDDEVEAAARAVGAHDMIATLDDGYLHEVSERGRNLSAGQRQLIALARAELVDPVILLLDEATAALDLATEARVNQATDRLVGRRGPHTSPDLHPSTSAHARTTLIVAHRLTTAARADRIVVLDHGRVVEDGTHDALVAANGHYARLWRTFLGEEDDADTRNGVDGADDSGGAGGAGGSGGSGGAGGSAGAAGAARSAGAAGSSGSSGSAGAADGRDARELDATAGR